MKGYAKIKLESPMTITEIYEKIKDGTYPTGAPELAGSGKLMRIDFPPTDKYKVIATVSGKTISITLTYNGVGGLAKESGLEFLTNGWSTIFNKNRDQTSSDLDLIKDEMEKYL